MVAVMPNNSRAVPWLIYIEAPMSEIESLPESDGIRDAFLPLPPVPVPM